MKKIFLLLFLLINCSDLFSQIKLPKLISNGVVLQRDTNLKLWGWASANEKIELKFKNEVFKTVADINGNWTINLSKQQAGGPFEMEFNASNTIKLNNILIGDVWVCSGQSNMELPLERVKENYVEFLRNTNNPNIRQFQVPDLYDFNIENTDFEYGNWVEASPENILNFSAVAYFFANELYKKYHIPIGLINSALGGSPVEAWISEDAIKQFPDNFNELQKFKNDGLIAEIEKSDTKRSNNWYQELNSKDAGLLNSNEKWSETTINDSDWDTMEIPSNWADTYLGTINGSVWFRKEIEIPISMVGKSGSLWMGRIIDADEVYLNGKLIGSTGYQYPPRRYSFDNKLLKEGKNTISVRVVSNSGTGGFVLDKPYFLAVENDTINLKGDWRYKLGTTMQPLESQTFIRWKPTGLYNKMIAPLLNFSIKGVIWYQGESNAENPKDYSKKFATLINNWRQKWNQGDFPFLYAQLPNFMEETTKPVESSWAELRHEQLKTLAVKNTGMTVNIDLGEWNDIHPLNKQDVGKRFALLAQKKAYNETTMFAENPAPSSTKFKKKCIIITLKNIGNGLISKDGKPLSYFSISNNGTDFVWAKAKIKGDKIKVWNSSIKNPTTVRYAWANNPATANLFTKDGLPATPFELRK